MTQPTLPRLELENVFRHDAAELVAARGKCVVIHHTKDIDAAGDEVEVVGRNVLRRKLPRRVYVGHGHVVDSQLLTSPQLDVIIADDANTPVLFTTENGTEYMPYESVYAVGEIKSSYSKSKKYIHCLSDTLHRINTQLRREQVSPRYLGNGIELGEGFSTGINVPYRNPLFSFILFVDAGDFKVDDIIDHYRTTPIHELPNVVCFLNRGALVNVRVLRADPHRMPSLNVQPRFNTPDSAEAVNRWAFIRLGGDDNRAALTLALLHFMLASHLTSTVLKAPDMTRYLNCIFSGIATAADVIDL